MLQLLHVKHLDLYLFISYVINRNKKDNRALKEINNLNFIHKNSNNFLTRNL